jgi:hypothetical protein
MSVVASVRFSDKNAPAAATLTDLQVLVNSPLLTMVIYHNKGLK